mgnify:CR=1 FL=1
MSKRKQVQVPIEKIQEQDRFIEAIAEKNSRFYAIHQTKPKYMIQTFGCQMNEHDSEKLCAMLDDMGYQRTMLAAECDLIIYNTCAVRENAELKVYGNLGQLKFNKRKNPDLKIAVCGCMMQQPHVVKELKSKYNHVDLVFGTHNLYKFPELLASSMESEGMLVDVWDVDGEVVEGLRSSRKFELKAFVNIMYGCNNFCTYCIVPYTRGRERSRTVEDIVNEIKELVANGTKEVTLLGQNVDSYGKTLDNPVTFAELLRIVNEIEGLERIRFMTSHPKDISDEVIYAMRDCDKVCEFMHLPVQCGSTRLLKKMNRHYSKEHYLEIIEKAKKEIPDIAFSTDLMIGFPGETEEDFNELVEFVKVAKFDRLGAFSYSREEDTPADKLPNHLEQDVKDERRDALMLVQQSISEELNAAKVGNIYEVLVEEQIEDKVYIGRTKGDAEEIDSIVYVKSDKKLNIGDFVSVKITSALEYDLMGDIVNELA